MKKDVVKRVAGIGLVVAAVVGLLAAGISADRKNRHDRREARVHSALTRLIGEWKELKQERLTARWHRELLQARGVAVDARLSMDAEKKRTGRASAPDSWTALMLSSAEKDVAKLERSVEQAPKVCDAAIDQMRQELYESAKVRDDAMTAAGAQPHEGQFDFLSRSNKDLSLRLYEPKVHDALRGSPFALETDTDPLRCAEWYDTVYSDKDLSTEDWYALWQQADAEADDGVIRHYTVEDAMRPQRWELRS